MNWALRDDGRYIYGRRLFRADDFSNTIFKRRRMMAG